VSESRTDAILSALQILDLVATKQQPILKGTIPLPSEFRELRPQYLEILLLARNVR